MTAQTLSTFNFESHAIRTIAINGEPWFLSVDICNALNISNSRDAISKLDEDEYQTLNLKDTVGLTDSIANQVQSVGIVSESGMYTLILRCREAVKKGSVPHRFRKWVTAEVLPQIRKTGQYSQKSTEIAPLTITPEQQQQIQNAVQATHHRTGLSYAEIYQRLKAKFHVAKYDQLRQDQHREAMIFIAGMSAIVAKTESGNVLKLSLIDVMSLLVYLKKVNKHYSQLLRIGRSLFNREIKDLEPIVVNCPYELLGEDYRHFLELINDYAKECDPYHKTLLKSTLTIN